MENNKERIKSRPKRGLWKPEEDLILKNYIETHGEGNWATVSKRSGLMRGGKSCRLRWKNYLRPNIKRGGMSKEEEDLIIRMHKLLGNRWSLIAGRLPGRTDNEVKNYWNTHLNKKSLLGKRKAAESNTQQVHHAEELHNEKTSINLQQQDSKKPTQLQQPTSPERTTDERVLMGLDEKKKPVTEVEEEMSSFNTDGTWMEVHTAAAAAAAAAAQCFNNYDCYDYYDYEMVETPLMVHPNCSNLVLDEEPFTSYLDSFVLFEAFGIDSDRVGLGIKSFLP